jgi:hypothetical protein
MNESKSNNKKCKKGSTNKKGKFMNVSIDFFVRIEKMKW